MVFKINDKRNIHNAVWFWDICRCNDDHFFFAYWIWVKMIPLTIGNVMLFANWTLGNKLQWKISIKIYIPIIWVKFCVNKPPEVETHSAHNFCNTIYWKKIKSITSTVGLSPTSNGMPCGKHLNYLPICQHPGSLAGPRYWLNLMH